MNHNSRSAGRYPAPYLIAPGLLALIVASIGGCNLFGSTVPDDAVRYDCGFGSRIAVAFEDGQATLWHQGRAFPLQAGEVASGMAYGDGYYAFRGKGDTATLSARDSVLFPECTRMPQPAKGN
ncbi:MAG: MliC family protein [Gammaproteobacteria bacterium]